MIHKWAILTNTKTGEMTRVQLTYDGGQWICSERAWKDAHRRIFWRTNNLVVCDTTLVVIRDDIYVKAQIVGYALAHKEAKGE